MLQPVEDKWDGFAFGLNKFSDDLFSDGIGQEIPVHY